MKTYQIPLDRIWSNTWQTRQTVDVDDIRELAADIRRRGLLQPPAGRFVDVDREAVSLAWIERQLSKRGQTWQLMTASPQGTGQVLKDLDLYVQLSFGHNRFYAFTYLAFDEDLDDYGTMPVQLQDLTDEDMAESAWAENAQRKDLSPIEAAAAIKKRMADFGWTQADVAERLGLARSTVTNKLRLLDLPADIQASLVAGEISERAASALLPLAQLPAPVVDRMQAFASYDARRLDTIYDQAKAGVSSDVIRDNVGLSLRGATKDLAPAGWPLDHPFDDGEMQHPTCVGCPLLVKRGDDVRCGDEACYALKADAWYAQQIVAAIDATGLPALPLDVWPSESFRYPPDAEWLPEIVAAGCDRLYVAQESGVAVGELFPDAGDIDARVCCWQENSYQCPCLKRLQASTEEAQAEKAREKALKAQYHERVKQPAVSALANAILADDVGAWRVVLGGVNHRLRGKAQDWSREQIAQRIAQTLVENAEPYYNTWTNLGKSSAAIEKLLAAAGLRAPWDDDLRVLVAWRARAERVLDWVYECRQAVPSPAAVQGNSDNLVTLFEEGRELEDVFGDEQVAETMGQIADAQATLSEILAVLLSEGGLTEAEARLAGTSEYSTPFKPRLDTASVPALEYALAFCSPDPQNSRRRKLVARLATLRQQATVSACAGPSARRTPA